MLHEPTDHSIRHVAEETRLSSVTDEQLVARIREGDRGAFTLLYDRHADVCFGVAMRIVRDRGHAEEVVQEAWLYAWRNLHRYDSARCRVGTWLVMVVRSRALDHVRAVKTRGQRERPTDDLDTPDPRPMPDEQAHHGQVSRYIHDAMAALSPDQRAALDLAFFEGLSHAQVAERLSTPLGTVKSRIRDGLRLLSTYLPREHKR
jgi:RNA polymerase sigma-70 factor (ECF subfamily)